jgi:hypothetical protein
MIFYTCLCVHIDEMGLFGFLHLFDFPNRIKIEILEVKVKDQVRTQTKGRTI